MVACGRKLLDLFDQRQQIDVGALEATLTGSARNGNSATRTHAAAASNRNDILPASDLTPVLLITWLSYRSPAVLASVHPGSPA
jgi:hypothetical protein